METVFIENETLRVGVMPGYGARVVSLLDKASGRDWIFGGAPSPEAGEQTVYLAEQAVGWDECFPTVAPWDADATVWGRTLRDHGDLWGRPWEVVSATPTELTTRYSAPAFTFTRRLALSGSTLEASYLVENRSSQPMPYLWALHGLLAVTPADRIGIDGVRDVEATYLNDSDRTLDPGTMQWPVDARLPFALDQVQPASRRFAGKFYADVPSRRATVGHGGELLTIAWDEGLSLGIWLNYSGWPQAGGTHHIALEPSSDGVDHLGESVAAGRAPIPAGGSRGWSVRLTAGRGVADRENS